MLKRVILTLLTFVTIVAIASDQRIHSNYKRGLFRDLFGDADTTRIVMDSTKVILVKDDSLCFYDPALGDTICLSEIALIDSVLAWIADSVSAAIDPDSVQHIIAFRWIEDGATVTISGVLVDTLGIATDTTMTFELSVGGSGRYTTVLKVDTTIIATHKSIAESLAVYSDPDTFWIATILLGSPAFEPLDSLYLADSPYIIPYRAAGGGGEGDYVLMYYPDTTGVTGLATLSYVSAITDTLWSINPDTVMSRASLDDSLSNYGLSRTKLITDSLRVFAPSVVTGTLNTYNIEVVDSVDAAAAMRITNQLATGTVSSNAAVYLATVDGSSMLAHTSINHAVWPDKTVLYDADEGIQLATSNSKPVVISFPVTTAHAFWPDSSLLTGKLKTDSIEIDGKTQWAFSRIQSAKGAVSIGHNADNHDTLTINLGYGLDQINPLAEDTLGVAIDTTEMATVKAVGDSTASAKAYGIQAAATVLGSPTYAASGDSVWFSAGYGMTVSVTGPSPGEYDVSVLIKADTTYLQTKDGIEWNKFVADSVVLSNGTSGYVVDDLQDAFDGDYYAITEATGTPGIDLKVYFTVGTKFNRVNIIGYYDGTSTHGVSIQLYNWSTSAWDDYDLMMTAVDLQNFDFDIYSNTSSPYVNNSTDVAIVRFVHEMAGNASHYMYLDCVALYRNR